MRKAKIYRYALAMDSGVILRNQSLTKRHGWIVEIEQNGEYGRGEIAPLPGFSLESFQDAGQQAQAQLETWVTGANFNFNSLYPSVAFGLSMAEMEMNDNLPTEGNFQTALLCKNTPEQYIPEITQQVETTEGNSQVAKLKVALAEPNLEAITVNTLLTSVPELTLRLDANQTWSLTTAQQFSEHLTPTVRKQISFIEEPCQLPADSLSFSKQTGIAIAWDETLQLAVKAPDFSFERLKGAKAIIIKPTLIGSTYFCIELINKAKALGMQIVISSSLESSLGLTQLARFAQLQLPASTPGLDTVNLFSHQLETPWPGCDLPMTTLNEQELVWQS